MRLSEYRAMLAWAMPSMSNLGEATLQFHCVRKMHTQKTHTPRKTGRNTIASLRAMEKSGGKYAPAKGKYHINVGTQFHCVRDTHPPKTHTPRETGRNTIASLRVMGKPHAG